MPLPLAAAWAGLFFFWVLTGSVVAPPALALTALGAAGLVYCCIWQRARLLALLREHAGIFAASLCLALAILWSEAAAAARGVPPSDAVPSQVALLLCLPTLALVLADSRILRAVVALFCAACLWHFLALPVEAVTGFKLGWHPVHLLERAAGPLRYQASGLAWQSFCFVGLYLPLFYLAWGPVAAGRVFARHPLPRWVLAALPVLWLVPVACVQSRSGLFGALCASVLAVLSLYRRPGWAGWLVLAAIAVLGGWAYLALFDGGKSGPGLRLAYALAYLREALDVQWLATGRGFSREAPATVQVPGLMTLAHSHNDWIQVFFSWGLAGLLSYTAFWFALLRLVWQRFVARGEYWPALALVALLPNMVTDAGFHFFEKAAFLVVLAAMCLACRPIAGQKGLQGPWNGRETLSNR